MTRGQYKFLRENDVIGPPKRTYHFRVTKPAADYHGVLEVTRVFPRPDGKRITLTYPSVKNWSRVRGAIA